MAGTAWNVFAAGQTASAARMNENWDWREGHLIPQSAGVQANNTNDLGTASNAFRSLYMTSIQFSGSSWQGIDGTTIAVSAGTLYVPTGAVNGSTANTSASERQIAQGTLSTPDFRDNAVTNYAQTGNSWAGMGTTITTSQIAATGGKILIIGHATINLAATATGPALEIAIDRDGTALNGGRLMRFHNRAGAAQFPISIAVIDAPAAGTYNYNMRYTVTGGSFSSIVFYNLSLLELKK